ncbi:hypothetical protein BSU80_12595, partial [Salmonella enterica subsp. enterica serovar Enteritidis]
MTVFIQNTEVIFPVLAGMNGEDVVSRFELLRTLAYAGWEESIHSGQHGENYFCILDEDSQ